MYQYENSNYYTSIKGQNNIISEINDKKHHDFDFIYTGVSYIYDYELFWNYLQELYENDRNNSCLSDVNSLVLMLQSGTLINYNVVKQWYDTGNLDSYEIIKNRFKPVYNVI